MFFPSLPALSDAETSPQRSFMAQNEFYRFVAVSLGGKHHLNPPK
jgi:hypothetical protein